VRASTKALPVRRCVAPVLGVLSQAARGPSAYNANLGLQLPAETRRALPAQRLMMREEKIRITDVDPCKGYLNKKQGRLCASSWSLLKQRARRSHAQPPPPLQRLLRRVSCSLFGLHAQRSRRFRPAVLTKGHVRGPRWRAGRPPPPPLCGINQGACAGPGRRFRSEVLTNEHVRGHAL
jgi:hypothetical protein